VNFTQSLELLISVSLPTDLSLATSQSSPL
jgi:hypothetical protein